MYLNNEKCYNFFDFLSLKQRRKKLRKKYMSTKQRKSLLMNLSTYKTVTLEVLRNGTYGNNEYSHILPRDLIKKT